MSYEFKYSNKKIIWDKIIEWYNGSTLEYYQKSQPPNRKGDQIGLFYMAILSLLQVSILTGFPVFVFLIFLSKYNIYIAMNFPMIWSVSISFMFPQFFYFWNDNFNYFLKKTKDWKG